MTDTTLGTTSGDPSREPHPLCAAAVETARQAALEVGGDDVGEHLGCTLLQPADDAPGGAELADHVFACTNAGYRGWQWCVTVAKVDGEDRVSVDEVVLLPGSEAILAPEWVPWSQRVRPGDLGAGDLLPTEPDDHRLVPAYGGYDVGEEADDVAVDDTGLGRARVMSREGRLDAAQRWHSGEAGPDTALARLAPARCGTCGFYLRLAGSLGRAFGVCANESTPDDGRVVSADHGCGAHSEAVEVPLLAQVDAPPPLVDDYHYEYEVSPS